MNLKELEKLLKKIDNEYYALGEYDYRYYSIAINDFEEESNSKYILTISTMRYIILQSIFFDEAKEIFHYLENVNFKVENDRL